MTRLTTDDISVVAKTLDDYDAELLRKAGCNLRAIACHAVGVDEKRVSDVIEPSLVGVVPMTCGLGLIDNFVHTVKGIVGHIGFKVFVTDETDVAGMAEAIEKNANIIMLADDNRFVAINIRYGRLIDNAEATGKGYATALNLMTGGMKGQEVLVIGCGQVGRAAALSLMRCGAEVSIYDVDRNRVNELAAELQRLFNKKIKVEKELGEALLRHRRLIDASPAADIIHEEHIFQDTIVCAPGVPLGLSYGAVKKISDRLLHDPLQIGVATMIIDAVSPLAIKFCAKRAENFRYEKV